MKQEVTNFARFYQAFKQLKEVGDREEMKRLLVLQETGGRTESLRELTRREYDHLCYDVETMTGQRDRLRAQRSVCLKLMQQMGIDTSEWMRVNDFCRNPRIAGCDFARIRYQELLTLERKLRAIKRKGELYDRPAGEASGRVTSGKATDTTAEPTVASQVIVWSIGMEAPC